MSESDSRIPGTVAALAEALEAVCQYVGSENASPGLFYVAFLRYLNALSPNPDPWNGTPEEEGKNVLATAARFLEAVDTAKRLLNAIPFSDLEPLSSFTDGVRWDIQTRCTLNEIQACISILHYGATNPDFLLFFLRPIGNEPLNNMQQELHKSSNELRKRIFDLQCLPDEPTNPTSAIPDKWNGDVQGLSNANTKVSHPTEQAETDLQELEEMDRNTPVLDTGSIKWIAARKENQEKLGYPTNTLATYRLKSSGGRQLSPYFGVDKDGRRWRRENEKTEKSTVYYFADDIKKYQRKVSN